MRRLLLSYSALMIIIVSCQPKYIKCNCSSKNEELKAYSEILNEIVEHSTYNFYLGEDEEKIHNDFVKHPADTTRIYKDVIRLQNKIFNDTSRFCTIYLDTVTTRKFRSWIYILQNDTSHYGNRLRNATYEISNNIQTITDSVGSIQTRYQPKEFTLCTSNIKMKSDFDTATNRCSLGVLIISKILFNDFKTKGLLYYEFAGTDGNLLLIEKVNGRWNIKTGFRIWQF